MNTNYKQDQRVYFRVTEGKEGWATIAGVQGFVIIIKPEKPIKNYQYSHIYVVDAQIVDPPQEKPEVEKAVWLGQI